MRLTNGCVTFAYAALGCAELLISSLVTTAQVQQMLGLPLTGATDAFLGHAEACHDYTLDDYLRIASRSKSTGKLRIH